MIIAKTIRSDERVNVSRMKRDENSPCALDSLYLVKPKKERSVEQVILFQQGPQKEDSSISGVFVEDLLEISVDRLLQHQDTEYRCRENAIAITKIEEALLWLNKRTLDG